MFTTEADVPACSFETNIGYTFCFLKRPILGNNSTESYVCLHKNIISY